MKKLIKNSKIEIALKSIGIILLLSYCIYTIIKLLGNI